ncbi:family 43 glycosylhydrolase [Mangrovibacterium marinum]|uniref:family 43 glycosylhydrolase n=1 Tax=Mangrovibacterium marinum TaxID=1639118 RepID=UPI002A186A6F|nr:family 43 glycosylhydrolase [Mangrovibacterium marinum]
MKNTFIVYLLVIVGFFTWRCSAEPDGYHAIHSGINWFDQNNDEVNAHGACIVEEAGKYYLFGEYKTDSANMFIGFSCYSSTDLQNWKFEKIVLPQQKDGLLGPNRIGERVKVMKCPETGEFVMYMHTDDRRYMDPHTGYATCETIDGDYEFHGALLYNGEPIRKWDMGTFKDTDGKGYLLIHHGTIYELSSDYKSATRIVTSGQEGGESPAMFKSNGVYYWLSSDLTSWERNDNFYLTANCMEGPWTNRGTFAPEGTLTWNSQCSFVLPITNKMDTLFMYMGDRWSFPKQGSAATQVWQPISLNGESMLIPEFIESWRVDFSNATWTPDKLDKRPIKEEFKTMEGNWEVLKNLKVSNQKGAIATYAFNGRQVGLNAVSNNTSGYAKVIIRNSKKDEIINTIVDFYSKYEYSSLKFLSPLMEKGNYTISIEVMGEHGVWYNKAGDVFGSQNDFIMINDLFVVDN